MNSQLALLVGFFKNKAHWPIPFIFLFVAAGVVNFVLLSTESATNARYGVHTAELRVLSQGIAKNAKEAAEGNDRAFLLLRESKQGFATRFNLLVSGDGGGSVFTANDLQALNSVWGEVDSNVQNIIQSEDVIIDFKEATNNAVLNISKIQSSYEEVVKALVAGGAASSQVAEAQKQIWRAERIVSSANNILKGSGDAATEASQLARDLKLFERVNDGFLKGDGGLGIARVNGNGERAELTKVEQAFATMKADIEQSLAATEELLAVRKASDVVFSASQKLLDESTALNNKLITKTAASIFPSPVFGGAAFLLAVIAGIVYFFLSLIEARHKRVSVEQENIHNQEAIMRLLDELGDLADGDLTVQATVTEDFTGAIADSINYSIDQMRELVSSINQSAVEVSSAAQETQATAMHLAEASEHQAQEIAGASAAVNEMAVSIDQVSANAAESSQVAQRSVEIAIKGSEVVQNTIRGMDTIREQIQDTSKRIKRLGESSQEIGDIVSLINDIADQTNILALNAAIQASMAGDAGRGFAVVADEVQRLAERASAATKQIEALVKTIQTDTNEAVISMENTTTEVVKGARLAEDAGVSLEEIENVSSNLADLIQNISNAARQQAASAGHISNTMNVIQEITSQTSAGTSATAKSIGNLAELAAQMRSSVAGFKLPG